MLSAIQYNPEVVGETCECSTVSLQCTQDIDHSLHLDSSTPSRRVAKWVAEYPLETVQRIMHLLFPITADYSFDSENRMEVDEEIFRHITWSPTATMTPSVDKQSITVVIQPPWILSPKDLELFATCRSVRSEF